MNELSNCIHVFYSSVKYILAFLHDCISSQLRFLKRKKITFHGRQRLRGIFRGVDGAGIFIKYSLYYPAMTKPFMNFPNLWQGIRGRPLGILLVPKLIKTLFIFNYWQTKISEQNSSHRMIFESPPSELTDSFQHWYSL